MADEMRVQKFLSKAGVCSRRKGEEFMQAGRVEVNGDICSELGSKVDPEHDEVRVDAEVVTLPNQYIYVLLNKPESYITSLNDPKDRAIITDLLPGNMPRIWPVGRLDWDSSGALLMTNDGKLTNLLTHPSHDVIKQYAVKVRGLITNNSPKLQTLRDGVSLDGVMTKPAHIQVVKDNGNNTWLEFIISEGKNRQIRRMCKAVGHPVMKLRRYAIGPLTLDGVPAGSHRPLLPEEVAGLYEAVEADMPERAQPSRSATKRERQRRKRHGKFDIRTHGPGNKHH
jgi:23S rRNA pseudouridine2605 synthase